MRHIRESSNHYTTWSNTETENIFVESAGPQCPICNDMQWLRFPVDPDNPNFGRAIPCECLLNEQKERTNKELEDLSNLAAFADKTFQQFDLRIKGAREPYDVARGYAEDPHGWLVLHGGVGVGKTHLAAAIANYCLQTYGMSVYFRVVPDLLDQLRATFDPDSGMAYDERFMMIRSCGLLVLDDLGTENATSWATEKLYQLINHRYNEQLPTVITTNLHVEAIDPRILSRIFDTQLTRYVPIQSDDYRLRKFKPLSQ